MGFLPCLSHPSFHLFLLSYSHDSDIKTDNREERDEGFTATTATLAYALHLVRFSSLHHISHPLPNLLHNRERERERAYVHSLANEWGKILILPFSFVVVVAVTWESMDGLTDIKIYVFVLDFYTVDLNIEWNVNSFFRLTQHRHSLCEHIAILSSLLVSEWVRDSSSTLKASE